MDARHRRARRELARNRPQGPLRLHLGCGPTLKQGWVNVDLEDPGADYRLDIRRDWPFEDGSVDTIYSEHFFEHLEYPGEVESFLREALRVLRPGGRRSSGVPDTEAILSAYASKNGEHFDSAREKGWHPTWCDTPLHSVNYHFRQGHEHKYAWDFETFARVLEQAGFTRTSEREYDPELDNEAWRAGTSYVDGYKPE